MLIIYLLIAAFLLFVLLKLVEFCVNIYISSLEEEKRKEKKSREFKKLFTMVMSSSNSGLVIDSHPNYEKWGTPSYKT